MSTVKIYTYSVLFSSSDAFKDKVPYISAILETETGERFASLVSGYQAGMEISVGQVVKACQEKPEDDVVYYL